MAALCLSVLTVGVVCLTADALPRALVTMSASSIGGCSNCGQNEVYGALSTPARPQTTGSSSTPAFTTFDVPGAGTGANQGTIPISINSTGEVTGFYLYGNQVAGGFVRSANGTITLIGAPDAGSGKNQGTFPTSINTGGNIAGIYSDKNNAYHGFLRSGATGAITEFDVPGAPTGTGHRGTNPVSINTAGDITGVYEDTSTVRHGFIRAQDGTFTTFDVPGAGTGLTQGTIPVSINKAGIVTGFYMDANRLYHGFLRTANGTITAPIDAPGAGTGPSGKGLLAIMGTVPLSIDAAGDIAGAYADSSRVHHGFVRAANGTITAPIDVPGAGTGASPGTDCASINTTGDIAGFYADSSGLFHGFVRPAATGTITAPFDAPGAAAGPAMLPGTFFLSLNDSGVITGPFSDAMGTFHGFVLTTGQAVVPAAPTLTVIPH